mmetsp:Transcript_30624/g.101876  ORF Transcript_30624/g.101876 Transcript_30624/m.101876 type:complete len:200 (+) Transcript_30624:2761-3360(+)
MLSLPSYLVYGLSNAKQMLDTRIRQRIKGSKAGDWAMTYHADFACLIFASIYCSLLLFVFFDPFRTSRCGINFPLMAAVTSIIDCSAAISLFLLSLSGLLLVVGSSSKICTTEWVFVASTSALTGALCNPSGLLWTHGEVTASVSRTPAVVRSSRSNTRCRGGPAPCTPSDIVSAMGRSRASASRSVQRVPPSTVPPRG